LSFLAQKKRPSYLTQITDAMTKGMRKGDFVRSFLSLLATKDFVQIGGTKLTPTYLLTGDYDKSVQFANETYSNSDIETPIDTQKYFELYGFDKFVASVSKWIDHENILQREYDIDRLWIGRYIDFLDKAKEYVFWHDSDQAIARKKIKEIREAQAKLKPKK